MSSGPTSTAAPSTTPVGDGDRAQPAPATSAPGGEPNPAPARDVAGELRRFLEDLLRVQCDAARAAAGLVFLGATTARSPGVAARWARDDRRSAPLLRGPGARTLEQLAQRALERLEAAPTTRVAVERLRLPAPTEALYGSEPEALVLIAPLAAVGRIEGVSLLVLEAPAMRDAEGAAERVALTASRFEAYLWEQQCLAEAQQKGMLRETLELLDATQQGASAPAMANILCHELQRRFGATRASIGFERAHRVRVLAVGGSDDPDRRTEAVHLIENAMDECLAQDAEVLFPTPPELERDPGARRVTRAHEALSRHGTPSAVLSLPLRHEGEAVGVVTLERDAQDPFPPGSVVLLRLVAEFAGPSLATRRLADRGPGRVALDGARRLGAALVGPRHTSVKLVLLLIFLVLLASALVPIPSRVTATGEVRAAVSRTITPPFAGYIASVAVEAGDEVREGQVLVRMDTSDLLLQIAELEGRRLTAITERDDAQGVRELARARLAEASLREIQAQLELLRDRVGRAEIRAPIDGVIARGELEPFVGALVQPDQPLVELVTPERKVTVLLRERDASRVRPGSSARFTPRATPDVRVGLTITRINPSADVEGGRVVYRAEATPDDPEVGARLRPGATGTIRVEDGRTTALRWLAGPLIDEARLRLWW